MIRAMSRKVKKIDYLHRLKGDNSFKVKLLYTNDQISFK